MKRLYLLRHAEAAATTSRDFDRPLTPAGQAYIRALRERLAGFDPDIVLCSPARRTRETLEALLPDRSDALRLEQKIYEANPGFLLSLLQDLPDSINDVLLVGHNPGIHGLALTLADDTDTSGALRFGYTPGTLSCLVFSESCWRNLAPGRAVLDKIYAP